MGLYNKDDVKVINGNMLEELDKLEENSIDNIVTDPPYELNFMNKGWDNAGISFQKETWEKCLRVIKPGGHLLAFGGSRTFHRIACAIEDAGFEIRDMIMWLYGSGFPKSMSISKGIEAVEKYGNASTVAKRVIEQSCDGNEYILSQTRNGIMGTKETVTRKEYVPESELAKKWDGWGTCLKPSFEPIIVARKPIVCSSVVDSVVENGTGAFNIDECRVHAEPGEYDIRHYTKEDCFQNLTPKKSKFQVKPQPSGRFPANILLTYNEDDKEDVCGGMPYTKGGNRHNTVVRKEDSTSYGGKKDAVNTRNEIDDEGSASRYFYNAMWSDKDLANDRPMDLYQYLIRLVSPKDSNILYLGNKESVAKAVEYENSSRNYNYKYLGVSL